MEYIKRQNNKYEGSSDVMEYLDELVFGAPCFWEEIKRQFLEAMQNYKNYSFGTQTTTYIRTVGPNRVVLFDLDNDDVEMELPFDALCNLTEKYFDIDEKDIDSFYLTLENEVFNVDIKYLDGTEEHLKFESCPEKFAQETMEAEQERIRELAKGDKLKPEIQCKVDAIDNCLKKYPNNVRLLLEKGFYLYEGANDYCCRYITEDAAIKVLSKAIEIDPNCIDAYFWLSAVYIRHDVFAERIIGFLEKAIIMAPDRADLYLNLAKVYKEISQDWYAAKKYNKEKYVGCLQKAIELEPTWIAPRGELVLFLARNKQFDFARQVLSEAYGIIQDDFPIPDNDISEFYEIYVTGRINGGYYLDDVSQYLDKKFKED